jgi:hypothetical protein
MFRNSIEVKRIQIHFVRVAFSYHADCDPAYEAYKENISRAGSGGYHPRNTRIPSDGRQ